MEGIITKNALQADIVNKFILYKKGYILLPGGSGKTITCIKCIKALSDNLIVHIVVPSLQLKDQWDKLLLEWKIYNATVYVINSYVKTLPKCDFLALDELHRFTEEDAVCFNRVIHETNPEYLLAMTATIKDIHRELLLSKNIILLKEASFAEAVENNWVSPFLEYNVFLYLTDEEQLEYDKINKKYENSFNYFLRNYDDAMGCLKKEYREEYCKRWNRDSKLTLLKSLDFSSSIKNRKGLIYNAFNKYQTVLNILEDNPDEEAIIFSESTNFCDNLHSILPNSTIYHSKIPEKKKKQNLNDFLEGKYKYLIGAKSVDQGFDKPSVALGIIASGTSSTLQHRQRIYRVTRFVKDKFSKIYNLVIKNTQDEQWLKIRQKDTKQKPIIS